MEILSLEDIAKNGMLKSENLTDAETDEESVKQMLRQKSQKWNKGLGSEIRLKIIARSIDVWRKKDKDKDKDKIEIL